jgi:hypothetical protein
VRLPFAHVGFYLSLQGVTPSAAQRRAIQNTSQFVISLMIFARRLRAYLHAYRSDSWADVPLNELFLDTQGLFLFVQQYLEDVALIVRMSFPVGQREQLPAAFRHLSKRLREQVLAADEPLYLFLQQEASWFDEFIDVRDDISHRTSFGRKRLATFPDVHDLFRAGGGAAPFLSGQDLHSYIGELFRHTLSLSCVVESFVYKRILEQHPVPNPTPPSFIVAGDEIDLTAVHNEPGFPLGTILMTFDRASIENLEYFLGTTPTYRLTPISPPLVNS